ncbi:MAG: hypothetical protein WA695_00545, partial [Candidatus Dormiibacterota bacterium]
ATTPPGRTTDHHDPSGRGRATPARTCLGAATSAGRTTNHHDPSGRRGATSASAVPETGTQGANRGGVAALGLRSCYSATRDQ